MKPTNGTARLGTGVTASAVRITPRIIHGCRPHSVTSQPASSARKPSGPAATTAVRSAAPWGPARAPGEHRADQRDEREQRSRARPWRRRRGGRAGCRRPVVARERRRAPSPPRAGSWKARSESPYGISSAKCVSPRLRVGECRPRAAARRARVSKCPSIAASFTGCVSATCRAERSPESGCRSAATPPSAARCRAPRGGRRSAGARRRKKAWMPATAKPVAGTGEEHVQRPRATSRAGTWPRAASHVPGAPAARRKPAGLFIQALASVTKKAETAPLSATIDAGCEVEPRRDALPTVEVDAEEDGLGEEGEALQREGHADDRPGERHEAGPEESELEGDHRAARPRRPRRGWRCPWPSGARARGGPRRRCVASATRPAP